MNDATEPTPDQSLSLDERFAVLALMTQPYGASNGELEAATGITIGRAERENLVGQGLIDARQDGRTWMHELTDRGWRRAEEELASGAPEGADPDTRVLYQVMGQFADWMKKSDLHVADIFTPDNAPAAADAGVGQAHRSAGFPTPATAIVSDRPTSEPSRTAPAPRSTHRRSHGSARGAER